MCALCVVPASAADVAPAVRPSLASRQGAAPANAAPSAAGPRHAEPQALARRLVLRSTPRDDPFATLMSAGRRKLCARGLLALSATARASPARTVPPTGFRRRCRGYAAI